MPTTSDQMPPGPHRDLVVALQELHRAAGWLSHRTVSKRVAEGTYPAMASHESVRTTLKGLRIPRWETVRSIVCVLAEACSPPRDPEAEAARFLPLWRAIRDGDSGALQSAQEFALAESWGADDGKWTPEMIAGAMINPFNAIQIDPSLAAPHEPIISEEKWIKVFARLVEESGAEFVARALLRTLQGNYVGAEQGAPYGYRAAHHEAAQVEEAFAYGCQRILRRLLSEPNLLSRSINAFHADDTIDKEEKEEVLRAESDASLMREILTVSPETWADTSEEVRLLLFDYLIAGIRPIGRSTLPAEERFQIMWRVPEHSQGVEDEA